MTKIFSPWADSDPYRRGHVIRAEEVNVKFEGITTAFDELEKLINQRVMLLPGSFDGNNVVDVGLVANTLLHINAQGNLSAYSLTAFENNVALTADYKDAAYASANSAGISLQQVQQLHDQVVLLESSVTSLSQQTTVAKDTAVTKAGEASASAASANDDKIAAANSAASANDDKSAAANSAATAGNHSSDAKTYRDEALSYRNTASSHKDAAAGSASSASSSAGSASNSASTATAQATLAEKWAQHPEDTAVESGKYSAYHWAQKAQEYAEAVDYSWSAIQGKPATATRWPSWGEVTSKPATFTPSSHGHSWTEITGKPELAFRVATPGQSLGVGWHTIAKIPTGRASAKFVIWETDGGSHQAVHFYAANHYSNNSAITVLSNSHYSGGGAFRYLRVLAAGTYDGALLQVYVDNSSTTGASAAMYENDQETGWELENWLTTEPIGGLSEQCRVDLDNTLSINTTAPIYENGQRVYSPSNKPSWLEITSKPSSFPPSSHGHSWSEISGPPATATRWPSWDEVTSKPGSFTPSSHGHPWSQISGPPATATRWPTKSEVGLGNVPNVNLEPIFYYNSGSRTLSGNSGKTRVVCLNWSQSPIFTINGGSFGVGSEIKIINQRGAGTITLTGDVMYAPDGSSSSTHTFSKAGTIHLVNYSSDRWMLQVY